MFVHLNCRSEFSIHAGTLRIEELIAHASQNGGMVALCDEGNMFAAVKFYKAACKAGVKPILGINLPFKWKEEVGLITLLAKDNKGYRRLNQLASLHSQLQHQDKTLPLSTLEEEDSDLSSLIALIGLDSPLGAYGLLQGAAALPELSQALLSLSCESVLAVETIHQDATRANSESAFLALAQNLSAQSGCPIVLTHSAFFYKEEDFESHEARVAIQAGYTLGAPNRPKLFTPNQWLMDKQTLARRLDPSLLPYLENSALLAKKCNVELEIGKPHLPLFQTPDHSQVDDYFTKLCQEGLASQVKQGNITPEQLPSYQARLDQEAETIKKMGYAGYYLIVMEFIHWSRSNGVPVGPGRGSGAGSLAAWTLEITRVDPLRFGLLFERFLNPERISLPDFDVDFCVRGRDRVIEHVRSLYGETKVAQIATHGTMKAKLVVRDVARVLGKPYAVGDRLAGLIGDELGLTLASALKTSPDLQRALEEDEELREVFELSKKLEGLVRSVGTHAGGVVIAPSTLTDYTALYTDDEGSVSTQLDMKDLEAVGLVKFDFLGLAAVTVVHDTFKEVLQLKQQVLAKPPLSDHEIIAQIDALPLDDAATYQMLQKGDTTAIFQLESGGMRELIKKLRPDNINDIVALVALFRPGPLKSGMVDDYVKRKHGLEEVASIHPLIDSVLEETHGVIVYQEQVMLAAQHLAGYSLGGADLLRRAMGKKLADEMDKEREKFCQGADANSISPKQAAEIFDLIANFADYGFNKSHSVAYALLAYQTAYLKCHHPDAFLAASCNVVIRDHEKIMPLVKEASQIGLEIIPPQINLCSAYFVGRENKFYYGLGGIRGVGASAALSLIQDRQTQGSYSHVLEFFRRAALSGLTKTSLQALIQSGACDEFKIPRSCLLDKLPEIITLCRKQLSDEQNGQGGLFEETTEAGFSEADTKAWVNHLDLTPDAIQQNLLLEKTGLGFYLTSHPVKLVRADLEDMTIESTQSLWHWYHRHKQEAKSGSFSAKGEPLSLLMVVASAKRRRAKGGQQFWNLVLEDEHNWIELILNPDEFRAHEKTLKDETAVLMVRGTPKADDFRGRPTIRLDSITPVNAVLARRFESVLIDLQPLSQDQFSSFIGLLRRYQDPEGVQVRLQVQTSLGEGGVAKGVFSLPLEGDQAFRVVPSLHLGDAVKHLFNCTVSRQPYAHH